MKCPHCEYEHDPGGSCYDGNDNYLEGVRGKLEGFYKMPVEMQRVRHTSEYYYDYAPTVSLYACPNCCKTFIES